MGLFNFLKKKSTVDKPTAPGSDEDLPPLTDLPPINGSSLPPSDPDEMPALPMPPASVPMGKTSKKEGSITVELPPLDFTLPVKDEEPAKTGLAHDSLPDFPPAEEPVKEEPVSTLQSLETPATVEHPVMDLSGDVNKLFFADKDWKEPDWDNYEPYPEPRIEPPKADDFGVTPKLPDAPKEDSDLDLPSFESGLKRRIMSDAPVDVFVRGKDYARVYSELDRINFLLDNQEPKILGIFEEVVDKEEDILKKSKDAMEYVYKRLMIIDKRIFG